MSYDICLLHVPPGKDAMTAWQDIGAALEGQGINPAGMARAEELAQALLRALPGLTRFHPDQPTSWIELNDEELQLQFIISELAIEIAVPYFRDNPRTLFERILQAQQQLEISAFDPQLGRTITRADLDQMVHQYELVGKKVKPMILNPPKPWWQLW